MVSFGKQSRGQKEQGGGAEWGGRGSGTGIYRSGGGARWPPSRERLELNRARLRGQGEVGERLGGAVLAGELRGQRIDRRRRALAAWSGRGELGTAGERERGYGGEGWRVERGSPRRAEAGRGPGGAKRRGHGCGEHGAVPRGRTMTMMILQRGPWQILFHHKPVLFHFFFLNQKLLGDLFEVPKHFIKI